MARTRHARLHSEIARRQRRNKRGQFAREPDVVVLDSNDESNPTLTTSSSSLKRQRAFGESILKPSSGSSSPQAPTHPLDASTVSSSISSIAGRHAVNSNTIDPAMGSSSKISLKLLIDNRAQKVLFAEAGKEFVDFVFSLLTLPIGAVAKLVSAGTMHGSVGRLYESVDRMGASYLQPGTDRSDLLQPKVLHPDSRELLLLLLGSRGGDGESPLGRFRLYTCAGYCATAASKAGITCPLCKMNMATEVAFVLPYAAAAASSSASGDEGGVGGYVKGVVTYMVTDGLEVTPLSAISSITLFNKFTAGKDVDLAEKFVTVGHDEGLALLKAVLRSDTVLSDVFLARKK